MAACDITIISSSIRKNLDPDVPHAYILVLSLLAKTSLVPIVDYKTTIPIPLHKFTSHLNDLDPSWIGMHITHACNYVINPTEMPKQSDDYEYSLAFQDDCTYALFESAQMQLRIKHKGMVKFFSTMSDAIVHRKQPDETHSMSINISFVFQPLVRKNEEISIEDIDLMPLETKSRMITYLPISNTRPSAVAQIKRFVPTCEYYRLSRKWDCRDKLDFFLKCVQQLEDEMVLHRLSELVLLTDETLVQYAAFNCAPRLHAQIREASLAVFTLEKLASIEAYITTAISELVHEQIESEELYETGVDEMTETDHLLPV